MSTTPAANAKETCTDGGSSLKYLPALILIVFGCLVTAAAQTNRSVYTSLGQKQCRVLKTAKAENDDFSARCPGTGGYKLILSEGDLRQNISVVTPKGEEHSLELWTIVSSGFSTVGPRVEWRVATQKRKATPVALIIRFNVSEDPESPQKLTSYLAVAKITANEICVTDKISAGPKANEEARHAADNAGTKPCLKDRK
jgi:hypothetical protein